MAEKNKQTKAATAVKKKETSSKKAPVKNSSGESYTGEIITICAGVLGLFIILSLWFNMGGMLGNALNTLLTGLFGCGAYLLPLVLIGSTVCHFVFREPAKHIYIAVLFLLLCAFLHFVHMVNVPEYVSAGIGALWSLGVASTGGGIFGGIIAEILVPLLGSVTTAILLIALILIDIVLLCKISILALLGSFFRFLGRSIRDCFSSVRNIDEDDSHKEAPDKDDKITIPVKLPDDDEEISIKNPLDDIPFTTEETIPENVEQLPLTEEEPTKNTGDNEKSAREESPDKDISKELEDSIEQPVQEYVFPTSDLLDVPVPTTKGEKIEQLRENAARLLEILQSFGVEAKITNVTRGSTVTRYEVVPAPGVKVSKITALDQDIAMRLPAENVRIEILPGSVGIEASNGKSSAVYIRDMIESKEFINHPSKVAAVLGRDVDGNVVVVDIAKMPHLLIAGATGSGKSVCINTIIASILYKATPEEVRLVMVDPKVVELEMYNGIPHLLVPIVTDPRKAAGALCWAVNEMEERYKKFAEHSVRNLSGYNEKAAALNMPKLPQIVIIIDELADLMMVAPGEVQDYICRLAQKARAAGMHLILATQRPSVDVITGLIKANIPSRFSFQVSSAIDSRTILDCGGAEKLMGKGDMLMMISGSNKLVRLQGAYVSDDDVERVTTFIKQNCNANYSSDIQKSIEGNSIGKQAAQESDDQVDELFDEAVEIAFELDQISTSMLQRRLKVGYARAGRLIDLMDKMQIISSYDGSNKPRTLRMTREQYYAMRAAQDGEPSDNPEENDEAPF